ncbi:uncharacterized protein [Gossypium hirsutum]|uniref:RNase H type-1 domain-containing protein n=1 Tax=Gossypium hirsutum TaxID=3635 RepID=A0A1U8NYV2_GOSHI|nr:uncharacterized protein LOC107952414 [Gossypium hirsutum]
MTGIEIARQTRNYMVELDAIEETRFTLQPAENTQQICRRGKITVYFDATFDRLSSRSTTGLLVLNEEGEILESKAVMHSEIVTSFTAESYAGLQAIKLGISMGLNKIEVVGDSKTIIKKCQRSDTDKSVIGAIIRDIQSKKDRFQEIDFHFIPKAENVYAHVIAKEALKRRESFYLMGGIPDSVRQAVESFWPKAPD